MKKRILKAIVLAAVFAFCFYSIMNVLWLKTFDTAIMKGFYSQPKNTLDAVYIGPSSVYRFWIGPEAFHSKGIAVYGLSTAEQPISAAKYLMIEADKTQKPNLYLVDLRSIAWTRYNEGDIRKVTDNMKFSINRINAINSMVKSIGLHSSTFNLEYYFSFIKYHSRWSSSLTDTSSTDGFGNFMGYGMNRSVSLLTNSVSQPYYTDKKKKLSALNKEYLVDLLKYCKENGKKVLFTISPFSATQAEAEDLNEAKGIVEQYGFPIFDGISLFNKIGMNCNTDFYSAHHTNVYGAKKFTDYLADYLVKNYNLPDHRSDSAYNSWKRSYNAYLKKIASYKAGK